MENVKENPKTFLASLKQKAKPLLDKMQPFLDKIPAGAKSSPDAKKKLQLSFGITKQSYLVALVVLGVAVVSFVVMTVLVWNKNSSLNERLWDLKELKNYSFLSDFSNNEAMRTQKDTMPTTIETLLATYESAKNEKEVIEGELNFKKSVYSEFLRNLLLPSLNIWKDPYTQEIDLTILGKKYLDQNPYQDIALLSQWSSIIRESGKDVGENEVVNMKIGDLKEGDDGFFMIPITISFKSDSKRAFLLLVNKLSLTSNINNLGLLNDFSYYLFNAIRELKSDEVEQLITDYGVQQPSDQDEKTFKNSVISRYLYSWLFTPDAEPNVLVDPKVVDLAVRESNVCPPTESDESCYFRFRDKYRTLPELAYGIGIESVVNKPLALKKFYASIPPLIAIESFTFDKAKAQGLSLANSNEYVGNVNFNIYGRGISQTETEEISSLLVESCFGSGNAGSLDAAGALVPVQQALDQSERGVQVDVKRMADLLELKDTLLEAQKDFDGLSPYNKMIKKFEFYRMLNNMGLCR